MACLSIRKRQKDKKSDFRGLLDFLGIVYGILSRKQLKLRVILGKKWYTGGGFGLLGRETIYEDTHLGLWRAGGIILSSGGILAQRKNLLSKEVTQLER